MKARVLEGKTIRKVHQHPFPSRTPALRWSRWSLSEIEFTDGSRLRFLVLEGEAEYGIAAMFVAGDGK